MAEISRHENIMGGAWVIDGTRIPAGAVKVFHEAGYSVAEIIEQYPTLTEEEVDAAIRFHAPVAQ